MTIEYSDNSTTLNYLWKDIYKQKLYDKAVEVEQSFGFNDGLFQGGWFDSIILELKNEKREKALTLAQDKLDFECLKAALDPTCKPIGDISYRRACSKNQNILEFQLSDQYVQDLQMPATSQFKVNPKQKVCSTLEYKNYFQVSSNEYVCQPKTGYKQTTDFDTVWSVIFTLNPNVMEVNEVWLVQDEDEDRTSTNMYTTQKEGSIITNSRFQFFGVS